MVYKKTIDTPVGSLLLVEEEGYISEITWSSERCDDTTPLLERTATELYEYLDGKRTVFSDTFKFMQGTPFQRRVWDGIAKVPYGHTITYGELAKSINSSPRAVGTACGKNPVPIIVPCHRIMGGKGKLTGFSGGDGTLTKEVLLTFEKSQKEGATATPVFDHLRKKLPQKPFYFVRHGQTDMNVKNIIQAGTIDPPLNNTGQQQALVAGTALANKDISTIWHSPTVRATQTAEHIHKKLSHRHHCELKENLLFTERCFGDYNGKKVANIPFDDIWQCTPKGESWLRLTCRIVDGLTDVLEEGTTPLFDGGGVPLIVSHGVVAKCLQELLQTGIRSNTIKNCQILYFEPPKKSALEAWHITEITHDINNKGA